ncbi:MAG: hypothetical protein KGQ93_13740 [Cyanobacteria bacterium REEB459]|nr:hypothetical protein [Cyanobacteria bacterium REEB459]
MKLWLVCFLLLFFAVEGWQWLGHTLWFSQLDLALPLVVAGGMGLAIASNWSRHPPPRLPLPAPLEPGASPAEPVEESAPQPTALSRSGPVASVPSISFRIARAPRQARQPTGPND